MYMEGALTDHIADHSRALLMLFHGDAKAQRLIDNQQRLAYAGLFARCEPAAAPPSGRPSWFAET